MKETMAQTRLDRDFLSIKQTAEYLQLSEMTVYRYIEEGKLKSVQLKPKGKHRISAESIEKLMRG